jgi:hypothetical protein
MDLPLPDIIHIHFDPTVAGRNIVDDLATIQAWLPIIGPTCSWFLYLTATWANQHHTTSYPTRSLAVALGISPTLLAKTLRRLNQFGLADWVSTDTFVITSPLPSLTHRQRRRLEQLAVDQVNA